MEQFDLNKAVKEISDSFTLTKNTLNNLHECKGQRERLERMRETCREAAGTSETPEQMRYFMSSVLSLEQSLALTGIEQVLIEIKCHLLNK